MMIALFDYIRVSQFSKFCQAKVFKTFHNLQYILQTPDAVEWLFDSKWQLEKQNKKISYWPEETIEGTEKKLYDI